MIRRKRSSSAGLLSAGAPYIERSDQPANAVDAALLHAWGAASPYLLSSLQRWRLNRFAQRVENQKKQLASLSDRALRGTAEGLRGPLLSADINSDEMAVAFALARESTQRHIGLHHYRVQLVGGAAMMTGALAEMQTGEGKTLTALLPAVAAALMGRRVHVVTVNDYLARRDAQQLRPVFNALGLTVGLVEHGQTHRLRQQAYACDVTYCSNKELAFDYLRDRLALGARRARTRLLLDELFRITPKPSQGLLLQGLDFAIVDEADSVLIDEARTPLILAGTQEAAETDAGLYETALDFARVLAPGEDFRVLKGDKAVRLTVFGERRIAARAAGLQGLWSIRRAREELVQQAISALQLFHRDVQYIVNKGKVQIVDEYTGRVMPDRSWERGLHQLIEAKENCAVTQRHHTLARITYQRFFRRYLHLCGMTGTAIEAAGELRSVYGLRVVRIPTNRPLRRTDFGTRIFPTAATKWDAVVESANKLARKNRAVLIGTRSVGASEHVGELLLKAGSQPVILNARQDLQEAEIIARAGNPGRITVATNMAGRGTDIQLHPSVRQAGGLHVILTEYHESRRIDRQLFGRAGRQGDPGSYECIVAINDELFQRFAGNHLLRAVANMEGRRTIPALFGQVFKLYSQSAAERLHAATRRMTLAEDHRLSKMLGFAGTE